MHRTKVFLKIFLYALVFSLGPFTRPVLSENFPFSARPNREHVRVRVDSTTQSPILGELKPDSPIDVISEKWEWYQIRLPSYITGFIHLDYTQPVSESEVLITAQRVNVRVSPSLESPILGQLKLNTRAQRVREEGEWISIRALPSLTGYVHSRLLTPVLPEEGPAAAAP